LASATGKPLGFLWIYVEGFIKLARKNLDSGLISSLRGLPTQSLGVNPTWNWTTASALLGAPLNAVYEHDARDELECALVFVYVWLGLRVKG